MASALIFPDLFFREVSKAARLPGCQAARLLAIFFAPMSPDCFHAC